MTETRYARTQKSDTGENNGISVFLILSVYHMLQDDDILGIPLVKYALSRSTFKEIKPLIHFCDNATAQSNKNVKAFKIRALLKHVNHGAYFTSIYQLMK